MFALLSHTRATPARVLCCVQDLARTTMPVRVPVVHNDAAWHGKGFQLFEQDWLVLETLLEPRGVHLYVTVCWCRESTLRCDPGRGGARGFRVEVSGSGGTL